MFLSLFIIGSETVSNWDEIMWLGCGHVLGQNRDIKRQMFGKMYKLKGKLLNKYAYKTMDEFMSWIEALFIKNIINH